MEAYDTAIETLTFGVSSMAKLSSSSSTSSTSSAASSSSSSQNSLHGHKSHHHNIKTEHSSVQTSATNQSDLICPLCKGIFKDPKLLNCLHVFCKQCLIAHSMSDCGDNASINCPQCKQETMIYDGIDNLQDDYIIHNMLDMRSIQDNTLTCTSCTSLDQATSRCQDCSQYLCQPCVKHHATFRMFEGHRVIAFKDLIKEYQKNLLTKSEQNLSEKSVRNQGVPVHRSLFCKVHVKEGLKYFCNSCQEPICAECVVHTHAMPLHQYERISMAEPQNVEDLEVLIGRAREKIGECSGEMTQTLDECLTDLQKRFEESRGLIEETHQSYRAVMDRQRDEVLKELEERHSSKEMIILDMHNSIEQSVGQLNDLIKFVQRYLTNGNCPEILMLKNLIANQLRYLTENLPEVYGIDINLKFQTTSVPQFEKLMHANYGRFATDKEIKEKLLNQLQSESMNNISEHQQQNNQSQAQKQLEIQTKLRNQEYLMSNLAKTQLQNMNSQFNPTTTRNPCVQQNNLTDHWIRNIVNPNIEEPTNIMSPQSSHSSQSTWFNNNNNALTQIQIQQQQKIMQNKLNMANSSSIQWAQKNQQMNHHQNFPVQNSFRSDTPQNFSMPTNSWQNFDNQTTQVDEFIPFSSNGNCPTQTKLLPISHSLNMNEFGLNTGPFSETHSNSSPSPPGGNSIGPIGSAFNSVIESVQQQRSQFQGNGNLNPPVRQNGKMSTMVIRNKFGTLGSGRVQFNSPHGFCLGLDEEIVVADTNNHRIHLFNKDGELKYSFGSPGKEESQLWYPRKVTVMRESGRFVVCDRGNERSRMQIFTKTGQFVKKISIRYIDIVAGLAVSKNNDIVAVDSVSPTVFRIQYETGDLMKWYDCSAFMREPSDIAIHGDEYYVCDFKGHCVVVLDLEGNLMRKIGGENITNFPNGIDVSDAGDVLVGDSHGNRFHIAVFTSMGDLVSEFECPSVKVSRCCGLKITSEGFVVTLAKNNHHVLVLNTLYVS